MKLKRVRKAIAGGLTGGIAAVGSAFVFTGAPTKAQVTQMIGAFIVGFAGGFYAVFKTPANAPAV